MKPLPQNPTKQQEIDYWTAFVESLPRNSYLRSMFADSLNTVENMIRNDFAFDPLPVLVHRQRETAEELQKLQEQVKQKQEEVAALGRECRTMENRRDYAKSELDKCREIAQRIARVS